MFFILKIIVSALIIGIVTEISRRFPSFGGMIAALPLVSLLSLIWLTVQGQSMNEISQFTRGVLWGLPATAALLLVVFFSLKQSVSLFPAILLGLGAWGLFIYIQELIIKH